MLKKLFNTLLGRQVVFQLWRLEFFDLIQKAIRFISEDPGAKLIYFKMIQVPYGGSRGKKIRLDLHYKLSNGYTWEAQMISYLWLSGDSGKSNTRIESVGKFFLKIAGRYAEINLQVSPPRLEREALESECKSCNNALMFFQEEFAS